MLCFIASIILLCFEETKQEQRPTVLIARNCLVSMQTVPCNAKRADGFRKLVLRLWWQWDGLGDTWRHSRGTGRPGEQAWPPKAQRRLSFPGRPPPPRPLQLPYLGPLGLGTGTLFPRHKWGFIRKVCFLVGGAQNTLSYRNTRLAWFLVWLQKFLKPGDRVPLGATSTGLISESLGPRDLCSRVYLETPVGQ